MKARDFLISSVQQQHRCHEGPLLTVPLTSLTKLRQIAQWLWPSWEIATYNVAAVFVSGTSTFAVNVDQPCKLNPVRTVVWGLISLFHCKYSILNNVSVKIILTVCTGVSQLDNNGVICVFVLCNLVYWQVPAQLQHNRITGIRHNNLHILYRWMVQLPRCHHCPRTPRWHHPGT